MRGITIKLAMVVSLSMAFTTTRNTDDHEEERSGREGDPDDTKNRLVEHLKTSPSREADIHHDSHVFFMSEKLAHDHFIASPWPVHRESHLLQVAAGCDGPIRAIPSGMQSDWDAVGMSASKSSTHLDEHGR